MAKQAKRIQKQNTKVSKNIFNLEFSDFSSLFTIVFAGYSVFMFTFWLIYMKSNPSESTDKLLFVGAGIFAVLMAVLSIKSPTLRSNPSWLYIAIISVSIGVIVKENQKMSREHVMGFGLSVFIIAIVITLLMPIVIRNAEKKKVLFPLALLSIFTLRDFKDIYTQNYKHLNIPEYAST